MIISTKELFRLPLCYIILTVSLSKCEIDSSSPIITTTPAPEKVQPGEGEKTGETTLPSTSAYSIPYSEETVKTSTSYSSSSSSFKDVAVPNTAVTFNNSKEQGQAEQGRQQQQADGLSFTTKIISNTISPNAVSTILTLPVLYTSQQQEVRDRGKEEVEQEKQGQPQLQSRLVTAQNQNNGNNEGHSVEPRVETLSSSVGASQTFNFNNDDAAAINAKYYEKMNSGVGAFFQYKRANVRAETKSDAVVGHSTDTLGIMPRLSSSLPRRQAFPRFFANKDKFVSFSLTGENNESRDDSGPEHNENQSSPIPMHTWIPAGLTFSCKNRVPGYYADASLISKCQIYHMCMTDGRKYTLLCGIGTVFNQLTFVCDHWYNYQCSEAESDYKINNRLWGELVGDDEVDEDELEMEDNDQNRSGAIRNDAVHHSSVPLLRSPFTVTSKISKTHDTLS